MTITIAIRHRQQHNYHHHRSLLACHWPGSSCSARFDGSSSWPLSAATTATGHKKNNTNDNTPYKKTQELPWDHGFGSSTHVERAFDIDEHRVHVVPMRSSQALCRRWALTKAMIFCEIHFLKPIQDITKTLGTVAQISLPGIQSQDSEIPFAFN